MLGTSALEGFEVNKSGVKNPFALGLLLHGKELLNSLRLVSLFLKEVDNQLIPDNDDIDSTK